MKSSTVTSHWELDALEPQVLEALVRENVLELRDEELWNEAVDEQESQRDRINEMIKQL